MQHACSCVGKYSKIFNQAFTLITNNSVTHCVFQLIWLSLHLFLLTEGIAFETRKWFSLFLGMINDSLRLHQNLSLLLIFFLRFFLYLGFNFIIFAQCTNFLSFLHKSSSVFIMEYPFYFKLAVKLFSVSFNRFPKPIRAQISLGTLEFSTIPLPNILISKLQVLYAVTDIPTNLLLHSRQDQNELHLKRRFFFAKIGETTKNATIFVRRKDKTNYPSNQT